MNLAYSTKFSNDDIRNAWKDLYGTEAFDIITFMLIYGDIDELMASDNPSEQLMVRKMISERLYELNDKFGEE